jgi:hypothetical protein
MRNMHYRGFILTGVLMCCGGCMTSRPISYVAPSDPVALVEVVYRTQRPRQATEPPPLMLRYVDGKTPGIGRGHNGSAYAVELTPGRHVLDVRIIEQIRPKGDRTILMNQPLVMELDARAGHNYRIYAHVYDANTVSLYIEDIITGEVVSGHRPEKPASP